MAGVSIKKSKLLKLICAALAVITLIALIQMNSYTKNVIEELSDSLIRLHVIANSDSPEDQKLKHEVRDAVLAYVKNEVKDSQDVELTRAVIRGKLDNITKVAEEVINKNNKNYKVVSMFGNYPFPTKSYGDIYLPAGNYQALRVVIGDGAGDNWWCVLFPPLCFVDVTHGTVPESVKDELKKVLTEEEYKIVTSSEDESDIPVRIRFKIVEVFQDTRIKLAGTIDRLFGAKG